MTRNRSKFHRAERVLSPSILGIVVLIGFVFVSISAEAQTTRTLNLQEAIQLGLENSKSLKLSQARIDEAVSRYNQAKDGALPTASASYAYNHAEIPTNTLQIGDGDPIHLPSRADAFIGTVSVQELIFAGNRLKYARESTDLLKRIAELDADKDRDAIAYEIIQAYYNLYRVQQSKQVVEKNLAAADRQLKQAQRFFEQGVVTKNDVLRFQLQKSNVEITGVDLESNRKVVNYDLNILLGLPENTEIAVADFANQGGNTNLADLVNEALNNREELKTSELQTQVAETQIKNIHAEQLPTLGVGASLYYINASGNFIPPANTFIAPISLGATLSWNFDRLWMNKNKIAEAKIQKREAEIGKSISADRVKSEVNQRYQQYTTALQKIRIYETSVAQATENDKILESKYKNSIASVTDRIDAQSQLFQTQINLELAKADAALAWYSLQRATGKLNN
jgi:outer membrane protein